MTHADRQTHFPTEAKVLWKTTQHSRHPFSRRLIRRCRAHACLILEAEDFSVELVLQKSQHRILSSRVDPSPARPSSTGIIFRQSCFKFVR